MEPRRGPLTAGESAVHRPQGHQKITDQLVAGGSAQTEHGLILHDDVIGEIRRHRNPSPCMPSARLESIRSTRKETRTSRLKSSRAIGG